MGFIKKIVLSLARRFVGATALILAVGASADTYFVDSAYQGANPDGTSWNSAFPTLPMAIAQAAADGGGEIWVKAGVYKPADTGRDATIQLLPNTIILGGFSGVETDRDQRNPKANRTVLSGDTGRVGSIKDNSFHVLTLAAGCRIDGFIIQRGNADGADAHGQGGGLLAPPGTKNMNIANCVFEKNNAKQGGAVHLMDSEISLTNCTFYSNSADAGGAIATEGESVLLVWDCIFSSNHSPTQGGAIAVGVGTDTTIERCSFLFNTTTGEGGAIAAIAGKEKNSILLSASHCRFDNNSATKGGGAAVFRGAFTPVLVNCLFEKNASPRGAGAIANAEGVTTVLTRATFAKNRGAKGRENFGVDTLSRVVESAEEGEQLAGQTRKNHALWKTPEPVKLIDSMPSAPETRMLPDLYVWSPSDVKIKLRDILADTKVSVVVLGDLTDPKFIAKYRSFEALALDYTPRGARFTYLYRHLKHPENNGFLPPFNEKERSRQARLAKDYLRTSIPWLRDALDNQAALALTGSSENAVFAFGADGVEIFTGTIDQTTALRKALGEALGESKKKTKANSRPAPSIQPVHKLEVKYVQRARITPRLDQMAALQLNPLQSRTPYYVKARVEADKKLLTTGNGKLYLGFHVDPLYKTRWNNMGDPVKYVLKAPQGVIAPSINSAPRVTAVPMDAEPREFILEARKLDLNKPLTLQVSYSVYSTLAKKNIEVSQRYIIYLQPDPCGGVVLHRQHRDRR